VAVESARVAEPSPDDALWMLHAAALAQRSRPSPNPRVGSVVVRDGEVVGEGWHHAVGADHAEVAALKSAGARARGATVYVTLEPCNHHGHTPPCTDALIAAGVARVVIGVRDPNPHVPGGGLEKLRAAGIEVSTDVESEACGRVIRAWRHFVVRARPFVVLKTGMTLDARIATRTGESQWITGPDARRDAHRLRAHADAVLVGLGTVLSDDPMLTPREVPLPGPAPLRVVLDSDLRIPVTSALVRTASNTPTLVVHAQDAPADRASALQALGVETLAVARTGAHLSLEEALAALGRRGIVELLVEGGGTIHGAFLDAHAADAVVCYIAPVLVGGREAVPAFGGAGVARLTDAHRLTGLQLEHVGADLKVSAEIAHVHRDHHGDR
jgi:diaminohydroxyphosphoribosylaminopyrimidine deaminase/5-amino-6-(5-phosphoribosylamino)uracil reductase